MDMMNKATKVQLKTDMAVESDEVPQPIATQEPSQEVGTTMAEESDIAADDQEEEEQQQHSDEPEAETMAAEEEEPTAASEVEVTTTVEQRLKQITEEVGKLASEQVVQPVAEVGRQSFMSLTDLIRNLRPNDKANPQIDSDYSNTMRVLGEPGAVIVESSRKVRNSQQNY